MSTFSNHLRETAYFLAILLLFQSCIAYKNKSVSAQEAAKHHKRHIKIETIDGGIYKVRWIEEREGQVYSITNTKKEYIDKSSVATIRRYDPQFSEISLDSDLNLSGNIEVITKNTHKDFDSYEGFKKHKFIKIEDEGQYIKGYKMTGKDTATVIIPLEKIKAIRVENKTGTIVGTTAIVIPGLWLTTIIAFAIGYLVTPKGF